MFEKPVWINRAVALGSADGAPPEGLRAKKMMSHSAWMAYLAMRELLSGLNWTEGRDQIACFLGVGASGSTAPELDRIVGASLDAKGEFSPQLFNTAGLAACNPLFAFQLMNNFTLCHGAILEHLGGPNAAMYSRGVGTVAALAEACFALDEGEATRAIAGGADTALHPVTHAELVSRDWLCQGLKPAEGAALLALSRDPADAASALARVERVSFHGGGRRVDLATLAEHLLRDSDWSRDDRIYVVAWGEPARRDLAAILEDARTEDLSPELGEALAATPALAWVRALERMRTQSVARAHVLSAGVDGGLGVVTFVRDIT